LCLSVIAFRHRESRLAVDAAAFFMLMRKGLRLLVNGLTDTSPEAMVSLSEELLLSDESEPYPLMLTSSPFTMIERL
jgi:hypothetical protein